MPDISNDYSDKWVVDQFLGRYNNVKSMVRYQATVYDFISLVNYKKITDIRKDEILNYLESIKDNAARVCHIKEFLKFLIPSGLLNTSIVNDGKFIEKLYNFKPIQKNAGRTAINYSLNTIIQIDNDIKTNYKNSPRENKRDYERMMKIALFWELLFDAGIKVGDVKTLKTKYLLNKNEYMSSGKKNIVAEMFFDEKPNIIKRIINDYYDDLLTDLGKKKTRDGFSNFSCLEHYNNDDLLVYGLLAQDIIAARNKFYIKCPNCGIERKTSSTNWVFVKHEDVEQKLLVCKICKGNDLNG